MLFRRQWKWYVGIFENFFFKILSTKIDAFDYKTLFSPKNTLNPQIVTWNHNKIKTLVVYSNFTVFGVKSSYIRGWIYPPENSDCQLRQNGERYYFRIMAFSVFYVNASLVTRHLAIWPLNYTIPLWAQIQQLNTHALRKTTRVHRRSEKVKKL